MTRDDLAIWLDGFFNQSTLRLRFEMELVPYVLASYNTNNISLWWHWQQPTFSLTNRCKIETAWTETLQADTCWNEICLESTRAEEPASCHAMDAYPKDYIVHNLPLVLLSGIAHEDDNSNTNSEYPSLQERGTTIESDFPLLTGPLVDNLRAAFIDHDASDAPWRPSNDVGRSNGIPLRIKTIKRVSCRLTDITSRAFIGLNLESGLDTNIVFMPVLSPSPAKSRIPFRSRLFLFLCCASRTFSNLTIDTGIINLSRWNSYALMDSQASRPDTSCHDQCLPINLRSQYGYPER